jgi:mannose-6-phosphate isomerase-like protein (cupin superfamily)
MLRKAEEMVGEVKHQLRGGKGSVEMKALFTPEEFKAKVRIFSILTLEPGSSIGVHAHVEEEEVYYILKGEGWVVENSGGYTVKPGDAVLTGNGGSHSIENKGTEPLELLAAVLVY